MARKRKLPDGMWQRGRTYYARFRSGGLLIRERLSSDFTVACEMLADVKLKAYRREQGEIDNDCLIADLAADWLEHCQQTLRPSSVKRYRENLKSLKRLIPARKVSQLAVQAITVYRKDRLAEGVAPRTVNMDVIALSTMLTWGVDHRLIGSNPIAGIKPLPGDEKRKVRRSLTVQEVTALFDASPERLRLVWRAFMTTGMREGELASLTFDMIDFADGTATVRERTAKNHRSRTIPLDEELLADIGKLLDSGEEHVFLDDNGKPWKQGKLLNAFYACCKRAGIEGAHRKGSVDTHALRVSFITLSLQNGANPKDVQEIVGHAGSAMTMDVYARATDRGKRAAVSALPFAKAADPSHVIPLPSVRAVCTTDSGASQVKDGKRFA